MPRAAAILAWPIDVVARPERLVSTSTEDVHRNVLFTLVEAVRLLVNYFANLLMYAAPLTLSGFGFGESATAPPVAARYLDPLVADPNRAWAFLSGLVQNSAFLLVATLLTFFTFHVGIVLIGASEGLLRSLRAVSYSTGIYLATMFTLVWYAATGPEIPVTERFLIWLQAEFIRFFIDFLGVDLVVPGDPPTSASLVGVSSLGLLILQGLLLSAVYFLYVLYVGARTGHGASRFEAVLATGFVLVSPALYVIGIILFTIRV